MIEIPATYGKPYRLERTDRGVICLSREMKSGHSVKTYFGPADAIAVCNAMVDLLEGEK